MPRERTKRSKRTIRSKRTSRNRFRGPYTPSNAEAKKAANDYERHKMVSVLAQIDLASCFRNEQEPLFAILSPLLYAAVER